MPGEAGRAAAITCTGLAKRFGSVEVLAPLDITLEAGRTTALVGPSGCGKSTLLRLVAGLETPSEGAVTIGGETPEAVRQAARLAMAFQDPALLPWRSLRGNIALACRLARRPKSSAAIDRLIELVGLSGFEDTRPAALSGGMKQRAAIARAIVTEPDLLLLDEPFSAVDALTRRQLGEDLAPIWRHRGTTTLLVTHSVQEAVMLADRILVFSARPARLVADISVPLAHPRGTSLSRDGRMLARIEAVEAALATGLSADRCALAAQ